MTVELVLALLVPLALLAGLGLGWLLHARLAGSAEAVRARALLDRSREELTRLERETAALRRELQAAHGDKARLEAQLEDGRTRLADERQLLAETGVRFRDAFQALAADALRSNNDAFIDLARTALGEFQQGAKAELERRREAVEQTVAPVKQTLEKLDGAVRELEKERASAYSRLHQQVSALEAGQRRVEAEAANLVKALRSPTTRGRWGEYQLRRVIELAGMVENCDFTEQAQVASEEGALRPDVIVRLPGGKTTVIDAKVPLAAYLEAIEAGDEEKRRQHLRSHAAQLRAHVEKLGSKAYWGPLASSPDFVILYVPIESAFTAALQADPGLIDHAVGCRVIPCGPMTLLTHLKAAAYGWRQERIAQNAQQISDLGRQLYDRLATLAGHFDELGRGLRRATRAYNDAVGSLEHRVLTSARRFRELGATSGDELPQLEPIGQRPRQVTTPELRAARETTPG